MCFAGWGARKMVYPCNTGVGWGLQPAWQSGATNCCCIPGPRFSEQRQTSMRAAHHAFRWTPVDSAESSGCNPPQATGNLRVRGSGKVANHRSLQAPWQKPSLCLYRARAVFDARTCRSSLSLWNDFALFQTKPLNHAPTAAFIFEKNLPDSLTLKPEPVPRISKVVCPFWHSLKTLLASKFVC